MVIVGADWNGGNEEAARVLIPKQRPTRAPRIISGGNQIWMIISALPAFFLTFQSSQATSSPPKNVVKG